MFKLFKLNYLIVLLAFSISIASAQDSNLNSFQNGSIKAIGVSAEKQSKYVALKTALIIAQRNLLEKVKGVSLYNLTQMKNSKITSDIIHTRVQGLIVGAQSCGEKYFEDKGYAEVCLQMPLHGHGGVFDVIYPVIKEYVPAEVPYRPLTPMKKNQSRPFDGLIVDVRHHLSFQPAIINRIIDHHGRTVYDPSMISHKLMMEAGPVQFATTRAKAEAILSDTGSVHPLFIRSENIKSHTDVVVSSKDAEKIYLNNLQSNMLHRAHVVFLLQ